MRIYMDSCCYNRPFDDQCQDRIRIESEVILTILSKCEEQLWTLLGSDILLHELSNIPNIERKRKTFIVCGLIKEFCDSNNFIRLRAKDFEAAGIKPLDSLHLASAEYMNADVLLTVDDNFIRASYKAGAKIKAENPVNWLMEVMKNG